jgi:hypothetical protein
LKVSFSVIFERFTVLETFLYSRKCQTLGVSPAKPGVYPLLIKLLKNIHCKKNHTHNNIKADSMDPAEPEFKHVKRPYYSTIIFYAGLV